MLRILSSFLLGILVAGATFSYAAEETTSVTVAIDNVAPSITSINLSSIPYGSAEYSNGITPAIGTTIFHITGVVHDGNGENNLATTTAVFYRTDLAASSSCSAFLKNCYRSTCELDTSYGSATEARYDCPVELASWADATDTDSAYADTTWTALVHTTDKSSLVATASNTTEVNSLLAITVPSTLSYGTLAPGATTTAANAVDMSISQGGNTASTVTIAATALSCSVSGSIPAENQHWSLTRTSYDNAAASFPLATNATSTGIYLERRVTTSAPATSSIFLALGVPTSGVGGTCTGSIILNTVASTNVGALVDSRIKGVRYTSTRNANGTTNNDGVFTRLTNDTVTFAIGTAVIGSISRDGATASEYIFPQDLVGVSRANVTDARVTRIARFLQSLDEDLDTSNGIQISDAAHAAISQEGLNIQTMTDGKLRQVLRDVYRTRSLISAEAAQAHLLKTTRTLDPEAFQK